jgi:hypothetical protein
MNNVAAVKELLAKLVESTSSPVYVVCKDIVLYLDKHPKQRNLTIGGLRAALKRTVSDDSVLIQAAFALTAYPFLALNVRYKLYDERIEDVIDELDHPTYMGAIADGRFIDYDGNELDIEELSSRAFPYFINQLKEDAVTKPHPKPRFISRSGR